MYIIVQEVEYVLRNSTLEIRLVGSICDSKVLLSLLKILYGFKR